MAILINFYDTLKPIRFSFCFIDLWKRTSTNLLFCHILIVLYKNIGRIKQWQSNIIESYPFSWCILIELINPHFQWTSIYFLLFLNNDLFPIEFRFLDFSWWHLAGFFLLDVIRTKCFFSVFEICIGCIELRIGFLEGGFAHRYIIIQL